MLSGSAVSGCAVECAGVSHAEVVILLRSAALVEEAAASEEVEAATLLSLVFFPRLIEYPPFPCEVLAEV